MNNANTNKITFFMILSILSDAKIRDISATASDYPVTNSALSVTNGRKRVEKSAVFMEYLFPQLLSLFGSLQLPFDAQLALAHRALRQIHATLDAEVRQTQPPRQAAVKDFLLRQRRACTAKLRHPIGTGSEYFRSQRLLLLVGKGDGHGLFAAQVACFFFLLLANLLIRPACLERLPAAAEFLLPSLGLAQGSRSPALPHAPPPIQEAPCPQKRKRPCPPCF